MLCWAGRVVVAIVVSGTESSLHNCLLPWVTWPKPGRPHSQQASGVTSSEGIASCFICDLGVNVLKLTCNVVLIDVVLPQLEM